MSTVMLSISCDKCGEFLCEVEKMTSRLARAQAIIKAAKAKHYRKCNGVEHMPAEAECPVCHKVMRKDHLAKHCAAVHSQTLINSMRPYEFDDMKKYKTPFIFGYYEEQRIIGVCLVCRKGGIRECRNKYNLDQSIGLISDRHVECQKEFDKVAHFLVQSGPRKQLQYGLVARSAPPVAADLPVLALPASSPPVAAPPPPPPVAAPPPPAPVAAPGPVMMPWSDETDEALTQFAEEEGVVVFEESKYEDIATYLLEEHKLLKSSNKELSAKNRQVEQTNDDFRIIISNLLRLIDDENLPLANALTPAQQEWVKRNV